MPDTVRIALAIAMQEKKICAAHDRLARQAASTIARADEKAATVARDLLRASDQLVFTRRHENAVRVRRNVAFIRDFDEHVRVAVVQYPAYSLLDATADGRLVPQSTRLTEIKQPEDDYYTERVGSLQHALQTSE